MPELSVDPVLTGRAQLGDLRALDQVLASIQEPLFRHISILIGDADAAEDVLQDVLLRISRKLATLRDARWFRPWAYRIATREAVRQTRRARRFRQALDPDHLANVPVEESFDAARIAEIWEAVEDLPPATQVAIRMHYLDGLRAELTKVVIHVQVPPTKPVGFRHAAHDRMRLPRKTPGLRGDTLYQRLEPLHIDRELDRPRA